MKNAGIELLRVLSMLMIVTLHVLGAGGILDKLEPLSLSYNVMWALEIFSYGAVNFFGLISGYLMCTKKMKWERVAKFWFEVFFLTLCMWIITRLLGWHELSWKAIFTNSLPFNTYLWYAKSYLGLLIMVPVLNAFLQTIDNRGLFLLGCGWFVVFTILPVLYTKDLFNVNNGYSMLWLCILYVFGGMIQKLELHNKITMKAYFFWGGVSAILVYLSKVLMEVLACYEKGEYVAHNTFVSYTSPLVLISSMAIFCGFLNIKMSLPKWFSYISTSVFGVYVIHMHYHINGRYITGKFAHYAEYGTGKMCVEVLGSILQIFICSLLVSMILMYCARKIEGLVLNRGAINRIKNII